MAAGASQATTVDGPPCRNPVETEQTRGRRGADGPRAAAPVHAGWRRGVRGREWECWEATCEERGARRQAGSTAEEVRPTDTTAPGNRSQPRSPGEGTGFPHRPPYRWYVIYSAAARLSRPAGRALRRRPRRSRRSDRAKDRVGALSGRRPPGRLTPRRALLTTSGDDPGGRGHVWSGEDCLQVTERCTFSSTCP